jgi:hypothetical protein
LCTFITQGDSAAPTFFEKYFGFKADKAGSIAFNGDDAIILFKVRAAVTAACVRAIAGPTNRPPPHYK